MEEDIIDLTEKQLNAENISRSVILPSCGAVAMFIGTTRDNFDGKEVLKLEYEAYESMAKKKMKEICKQIRSKWKLGRIAIIHRLGKSIKIMILPGKRIRNVPGAKKQEKKKIFHKMFLKN